MKQSHAKVYHPQAHFPQQQILIILNVILWAAAIGALVLLAPAFAASVNVSLPSLAQSNADTSVAANAEQLYATDPTLREQAIQALGEAAHSGSADAVAKLTVFFNRDDYVVEHGLTTARAIARAGTRPAYQTLIQGFRLSKSQTRRQAAMAALEKANPNATPALISALEDTDPGVRSTSAELLGFRHDLAASAALAKATRDADSGVRAAAIWALGGDLAVWSALDRIQQLRAADPDPRVRELAHLAEERIHNSIARAIGIAPGNLLQVSTAPANGQLYVATPDVLYTARDSSDWREVSTLPDRPTALAAGGQDGQVVYLGTFSSGPFRSNDGGVSWHRIATGLPAAERLSVTSLHITPAENGHARQVTMELSAVFGTTELHQTPLGIFQTADGGDSWWLVAEGSAPRD